MTTGTRIVDLRTSQTTACGTGLAGLYSSKTWSGADSPTLPRRTRVVTSFRGNSKLVPWITKSGRRTMKRVVLPATQHSYTRAWGPKRARLKTENAYTMNAVRFNDGYLNWRPSWDPVWRTGTLASCAGLGSPSGDIAWTADDDSVLNGKIQAKLLGNPLNVGVFLAELPQAAKMIVDASVRISRALKRAKRGDWWGAENALVNGLISPTQMSNLKKRKSAANNWLELQYGWQPLLSDIYSGAEMLAHMTESPFQEVVRVRRSKREAGHWAYASAVFGMWSTCYMERRKSIKCIITEVNVPKLIGLTDPAQVLWEKLPWSFVVDWFLPIGNYLEARGLSQSVTGKFVTTNTKRSVARKLVTNPVIGNLIANGGGLFYESMEMSRTVANALQTTLPSFKPLKKVASWQHIANAVALVTQIKL